MHSMGVGLASKVGLKIHSMEIIALARVFEREPGWYKSSRIALRPPVRQVGEAHLSFHLDNFQIHHIFQHLRAGGKIKPIFDEWVYLQFQKEKKMGKYTSQPVPREDMLILYHADERTRHTDMGIYVFDERGQIERLSYLAETYVMFEEEIYFVPTYVADIIF